jgi:hypothetical protein
MPAHVFDQLTVPQQLREGAADVFQDLVKGVICTMIRTSNFKGLQFQQLSVMSADHW